MRTNLIIGGSHGISKNLVALQLAAGEKVICLCRTAETIEAHPNLKVFNFDVMTDEISSIGLEAEFESLDSFTFCPGSISLKPVARVQIEQVIQDLNLNLFSALKIIQSILPALKKSPRSPSILMFSSVIVGMGMPMHTQVGIVKGAVEGFVRNLAAELSPSIRVNALAPSLTETPLAGTLVSNEKMKQASIERHPLKRIGSSEEIAKLAYLITSDSLPFMTGQILGIDGGMSRIRA